MWVDEHLSSVHEMAWKCWREEAPQMQGRNPSRPLPPYQPRVGEGRLTWSRRQEADVDVNQHWWTRGLENLYTVLNHLEWNNKDQKWFQFSIRRIRMEEFEDFRRFSRDKSGNWPDGRFGSRCCPDGILPIGWSDSYRD
jgi:hypothetical protein